MLSLQRVEDEKRAEEAMKRSKEEAERSKEDEERRKREEGEVHSWSHIPKVVKPKSFEAHKFSKLLTLFLRAGGCSRS